MVGIKEESDKFEDSKAKRRRVSSSHIEPIVFDRQKLKRVHLCTAKPSYLLSIGPKASRSEYLSKLPGLLRELLRKRNWSDASRVLSVLMKGTLKDHCPKMTRLKYEAHIQIVSHSETKKNKADEIGRIYDTWIGQIGKQHKEERLLVWYEQICHFIEHEMNSEAYCATISLMQNRDFGMLPRASLFIGIIFYKMWRSKFLKELQPEETSSGCNSAASVETVSNLSQSRTDSQVECSGRDESIVSVVSEVSARTDSETSVMYCKKVSYMSITDSGTKMHTKVKLENTPNFTSSPQPYATSEENEASLQDGVEFNPTVIEKLGDMDPWLLPLTPPDDPVCFKKIVDDSYYKEAVKYLRQTLQSSSHVSLDALHPLVQLLVIGGHVVEAKKVAKEMCKKVHDLKSFRIKALMMEKSHSSSKRLAKCYEDILKIDPSCVTTLKKLIEMCAEDEYSRESLIEMIGLHVEASFPEPEMWKELASCFSHFENLDEDRMSACLEDGSEDNLKPQTYSVRYNRKPKMFSNTSWTLRAKWWLNRHFSQEMLETELKKGEWEMMTYKAACASHIYGQDFGYVTKVFGGLKNNNNVELFNILREHRRNWNKIYNFE